MKTKSTNNLIKSIKVQGAKLHNLKNISVEIPHNSITVITGLSGSGKSSLAFDSIYAEGQRRFVESLSAYARQFLERMGKPDVDNITGLQPAIAIEQKSLGSNPRSTVGTTTEIYDYLRLLFGRIGITKCKLCKKEVKKDNANSIINNLINNYLAEKIYVLFPLSLKSNDINEEIKKYKELGFFRIVLNNSNDIIDLESDNFEIINNNSVYFLVDRLIIKNDKESITRLTDSVESALSSGSGRIIIRLINSQTDIKFSSKYECADCEIEYREPDPRLFSFNNPYGACPHCQGFGWTIGLDDDLIIPDKTRSLSKHAISPFRTQGYMVNYRDLLYEAPKRGVSVDIPFEQLNEEELDFVWNGGDTYIGLNNFFKYLEENNYKIQNKVLLNKYRGYTRCRHCGGSRLRTSARQVYINEKNIPELIKMPLEELYEFFINIQLTEYQEQIVSELIRELRQRIKLLIDIGLEYLTIDRLSHTLSGGESQRINLSAALGSSLVGTLYILDEPSVGMHPRDTKRLLDILFRLRNLGNTIIVVEHDLDIVKAADYIIDMGPLAGINGGEIVFAGTNSELIKSKKSITAKYINGEKKIELPKTRNKGNGNVLTIIKPRLNNLKFDELSIPLGCMVAVTGVSGSGKSTLIKDVLFENTKKILHNLPYQMGEFNKINGLNHIDLIEMVDQSPIGKSTRSTPVTFTKTFDLIRDLFANTQAAKQLGLKSGYFSFNVPGGRCEQCEGEGTIKVDMQFLPDVHLECEACKGTRYRKEARSILFKGKSIVDVLNMSIDDAIELFKEQPKIANKLQILSDVGLGYLQLGQPSTMLSGGESQRIKLASHLEAVDKKHTLFIFDEPTTGLHLDDISKLLYCFKKLVESHNSVILIEHNISVIAASDWIIDLGPEAGNQGGNLVACDTPENLAKVNCSYTGQALKEYFQNI